MALRILNKSAQTLVFLFLICGCGNDQKKSDLIASDESKPHENLLMIGYDTVRLKIIDSTVCEVFHHHDRTGRFKEEKIRMFEASKTDTIDIKGYTNYYDPFFNDCYDDCECNFLDTTADHKIKLIAVSRYLGETSPDELIKNLERRLEFLSPSGVYTIAALRFSAYCPDGKCQWHWSMGNPELPLNDELKSDLRTDFKKGTYLVLKVIVAKDEKGNYVRIHPGLCWHYK